MKQYLYSVRNILTDYFGNDPLSKMRNRNAMRQEYAGFERVALPLQEIPILMEAAPLHTKAMHGFVLQLTYANHEVRNYYLNMFDTWEVPEKVCVNGVTFSEADMASVKIEKNGIRFSNGYSISKEHLYYHSYLQVQPEIKDTIAFENDCILVREAYRLPRSQFYLAKHDSNGTVGRFRAAEALWDKNGNRKLQVSFFSKSFHDEIPYVCIEPTGKYGLLREDGSWLAPPIFDKMDGMNDDLSIATKIIGDKECKMIIEKDGEKNAYIDTADCYSFSNNRMLFNAKEWTGSFPKGCVHFELRDLFPGTWGYMDRKGNIVIEPQYTFATSFGYTDGEHALVAQVIDGVLRWGVINRDGEVTVPLRYEKLDSWNGDGVYYWTDESDLCGFMDFDGNILMEPIFPFIREYQKTTGLLIAGDEEIDGVYSLREKRLIIPCRYGHIEFGDYIITCENVETGKEEYFDYEGNRLDFSEYDSVLDWEDGIRVRRSGCAALIKPDKTMLIPFILEGQGSYSDNCFDLYRKGFLFTHNEGKYGLSTIDGTKVIPTEYEHISVKEDCIIAWRSREWSDVKKNEIYSLDGKLISEDLYYSIEAENGWIVAKTPYEEVHYEVIYKYRGN